MIEAALLLIVALAVVVAVKMGRRSLAALAEDAEDKRGSGDVPVAAAPQPAPAAFPLALALPTPAPPSPARTTQLDVLDSLGVDPATKRFLELLRDCPTPNLDDERLMAMRLAGHIAKMDGPVRSSANNGPDVVFREHVGAELKRPVGGGFSASEIDRACGQILKYSDSWRGPLVLVLFSRSAPEFDARLRALLGDAKLRNRPGGPLLVAWKARGFFKVVAPA